MLNFIEDLPSAPFSALFAVFSIIFSLLLYLRVVDSFQLYFDKCLIFEHHEVWRLFTSMFCFGPLGISAVLHIITLIQHSSKIEISLFSGKPIDFIIFCIVGWIAIWTYSIYTPNLFLGNAFSSYVLYYSAKRFPDEMFFLIFLPFPLHVGFLPIILLILDFFYKDEVFYQNLFGYMVAHVYLFLKDIIDVRYDVRILSAPEGVNRFFRNLAGN